MNTRAPTSWLAFALIFILSLKAIAGDVPDRRHFLEKYPADARKIEQAYRSLTLKTRLEFPSRPDKKFMAHFAANGDFVRADEGASIVIAGPKRSFVVAPKKDSDSFELLKMGVGATVYQQQLDHIRLKVELIHFPTSFYEVPLVDIFSDKSEYKLEGITAETYEQRQAFTAHVQETMKDGFVRNLDFTFPVEHPWVVLKRKVWVNEHSRVWEATYDDSISGVPLPTEIKCIAHEDNEHGLSYINKITELSKERPPLSEFQLARYGIKDPLGEPVNYDWLWISACGLVSVVLIVGVRKVWSAKAKP